ncbi:hypothetical protein L202_03893 [Cryptococcus amylolentus CBS 6039]|uniref:NAD-dependent epimerase/dehydratase domain-containing protein n=1 Tax=Cryptococcus amylolentus CBS 6039 TaxID=1295533 RepID=A0A1E3HWT6_9TREE|nr:hypothetical protein L202_03893 [Cryptococcus amylolentus CBS 6039]ODN80031.1 hypothetical protein L202_03893 [Cryptococcus amylolentus CBS 6039]
MTPNSPLIAITGIEGFIATELVLLFLARGWHVRGSARTFTQAEKLKSLPAYEKYFASGQLEVVVVADVAKADFTELLEGADAVASLAAPIPKLGDPTITWSDFKRPTIDPVLRILDYAKKSTTIKSVAIMSSSGSSIRLDHQPNKVYTEDDGTPYTEEYCESPSAATHRLATVIWYYAAKKYAEEAVLKWQETEKPSFAISTFCPSMVYGPAHYIPSLANLKALTGSTDEFLNLFIGKDQPFPRQFSRSFVDVRDVAEAFYLGITKEASGKYLVSGHEYSWQEFADKLRGLRPDLDAYFPLGEPGTRIPEDWSMDSSKSKRALGIEYRSTEETLKGAIDFFEGLGLFKQAPLWAKAA